MACCDLGQLLGDQVSVKGKGRKEVRGKGALEQGFGYTFLP